MALWGSNLLCYRLSYNRTKELGRYTKVFMEKIGVQEDSEGCKGDFTQMFWEVVPSIWESKGDRAEASEGAGEVWAMGSVGAGTIEIEDSP